MDPEAEAHTPFEAEMSPALPIAVTAPLATEDDPVDPADELHIQKNHTVEADIRAAAAEAAEEVTEVVVFP